MLKLDKTLCVFDLETTGIKITEDRIVEIAIIKLNVDGSKEEYHKLVNPEMIIPDEVSEIHGITNKDVATEPTFEMLAHEISDFFGDSDIGGFYSNGFDLPLLQQEFERVGVNFSLRGRRFIDASAIFQRKEPRTLTAAYKFYCDKTLENAHSALADTRATADVILAQAQRYEDLSANPDKMHQISMGDKIDLTGRFRRKGNDVVFAFGKHKGKTLAQVLSKEPGYYSWMMNADFPIDTKEVLQAEKEKLDA